MDHGIDVCRCGAVVAGCRCPEPHTPHVACQSCAECRSTTAYAPPAPVVPPLGRARSTSRELLAVVTPDDIRDVVLLAELRTLVARRPSVLSRVRDALDDATRHEEDRRARGLTVAADEHLDEREALALLLDLALARPRAADPHAPMVAPAPAGGQ